MRGSENITLIENEEIVYEGKKISEIFNEFFGNAVTNLNIPEAEYSPLIIEGETNTVSIAIKRYEKHPSIEKIKNTAHQIFSFQHVSIDEIKKEIMNLDHTKASQENDIPVKLLKANADIICGIIVADFNNNLIDNRIVKDCQCNTCLQKRF